MTTLWISTRKGVFNLQADNKRKKWTLKGPQLLGHIIHHVVQDPRDHKRLLMAAKTGHLGPTVYRSTNHGKTWKEATKPPAFRKASEGEEARAVQRVVWLTPGHRDIKGSWYAGTSPAGLFYSRDHGDSWEPVAGFNDHPMRNKWILNGTPDGEFLHSILVDPRDPNHLYFGISIGGVFESTDAGASWLPLNQGIEADYLPDPDAEYGHDPHCIAMHPAHPDRLYQQNHCGLYRIDRPSSKWQRIGRNLPKKIGDVGFPVVLKASDPDTAWVVPMDGTTVWPRTSIDGKPAVYRTSNGGKTWKRLDKGLPASQAWLTVLRQAMCADSQARTGVYFGTTSGEVWASIDEGESWKCVAQRLPEIYAVGVAE